MFGITGSIGLMLILISLGSFFLALAIPEIMAVSEDYVNRLGKYSNDMVGLERSAVSSGYIIGPIFAGGVASILGNHLTFSVIGVVIILVSLLALILTPEKIFLPQKELSQQK
jgi:MFS family permease